MPRDDQPDLVILETDLDDASPETLGELPELLRGAGAKRVSIHPAVGKHSRSGHLVRAIGDPSAADDIATALARETGTLGVRELPATHRLVADIDWRTAVLEFDGTENEIDVKVAYLEDEVYDLSAEHDHAATVAAETDRPSREIRARAEAAVRGDPTDYIIHLVEPDTALFEETGTVYKPPSLERSGFIHCAKPEQVPAVANSVHGDAPALTALVIDPRRTDAPLKYEPTPTGHYPHLYGPLPQAAVGDRVKLTRTDGQWNLPTF